MITLYFFAPLGLLRIWRISANSGPIGKIIIPVLGISVTDVLQVFNLWMLPALALRPRVLNAWVAKHSDAWRSNGFDNNPTVARCTGYISLPCRLNDAIIGEFIEKPSTSFLEQLLDSKNSWIEVVGQGGSGKTMLTVQLARWMQQSNDQKKISYIPIMIEREFSENIAEELLQYIKEQLRAATREIIELRLLKALLKYGIIVPIFDRLSERNDQTIKSVRQLQGKISIGLAVVSARHEFDFTGGRVTIIYPQSLNSGVTMSFIERLLKQSQCNYFEGFIQQVDLAKHLADIISSGNELDNQKTLTLTPLLVRIFVESALKLIEADRSLQELPSSIPDCYFTYLNDLNPQDPSVPFYFDKRNLFKAARELAKLSLTHMYIPRSILWDDAWEQLKQLKIEDDEAKHLIERLKLNGVIIERDDGARSTLSFSLDPLAEYLAADEWVYSIVNSSSPATNYKQLRKHVLAQGEHANGFLEALEVTWQVRRRDID